MTGRSDPVTAERVLNGSGFSLARELAEVSRLVEDDDVASALQRFVTRTVHAVAVCEHAGIVVAATDGRAEAVAVDAPGTRELVGLMCSAGPVAEALRFREPRRVDDTLLDQRWPSLGARLADAGCRSCLVLPLPRHRSPAAVLVLSSSKPHQFGAEVYDVVLLLTMHAGVAFDNAKLYHDSRRLVKQLNTALRTRQTIGQAQGLLMHRFGCDSGRSLALLKGGSQNSNTKLREVAAGLVNAHEHGELPAALTRFGIDADAAAAPSGTS